MVVINICLVGEQKDCSFKGIELDNQILYIDLKKRIETITYISVDFQEIKFCDQDLPAFLHPLESIKDFEEVVVRHSLSSQWSNYLSIVQDFSDAKDNRTKKRKAIDADNQSNQLKSAKLFSAYLAFHSEFLCLQREYATFLDNIPTFIKEAVKSFFIRKFSDNIIDVEFKDKPSGTRSGAICVIKIDEVQRVFYTKTNHNASSISTTHRGTLDIIELFIYKLLEVLNVGAVVEFIPNIVASDRIVYICGEEIAGFKTMAMLENDWVGFERKLIGTREAFVRGIVQLSLLTQILGLGDLNAENIGFCESNASLCIVDFRTGFIDSSIGFEGINRPKTALSLVAQLKMNLGKFFDLVKELTFEEQLEIAKQSIIQWEIISKLDVALVKLNEAKEVFNRADLLFGKGTETLKEYINVVQEKINQINNS